MKHLLRVPLGIVCLLLAVASCGPDDHAPENTFHIELPVVAECGSVPEGRWVLSVLITKDGDIYVPGEADPMGVTDFREYLDARWEEQGPEGREPDEAPGYGASRTHVLLRADARVPWPIPVWTLLVCGGSGRIRHFSLACVCSLDGAEGTIAFPCATSTIQYSGSSGMNPRFESCVRVRAADTRRIDSGRIVAEIAGTPADVQQVTWYDIVAADTKAHCIPWGDILDLAVTLCRRGVKRVAFGAVQPSNVTAFDREQQRSWLEKLGTGRLSLDAQTFMGYPVSPERVPTLPERRHAGPWGVSRGDVTWSPCDAEEDDVEEMPAPPDPGPARDDR